MQYPFLVDRKETNSDDAAGVAAYKTVELDGSLGGTTERCRSTRANSSPLTSPRGLVMWTMFAPRISTLDCSHKGSGS